MNVIDLHCDTIMHFYQGKHLNGMENTHINLEKLVKGGVLAQCFAIFVPSHETAAREGLQDTPAEYFDKAYARYQEEMDLNSGVIRRAFSASDILKNEKEGFVSSVLTVEDGVTLDGKIENVDKYFEQGIRMVALTWNYENSLGFPNSREPEKHMLGLKPFGIEAVQRMNELGIIADVSHLSEGGFWDVAKYSKKPFIASHSCARALQDISRNLTDDQLRAIAESGGVVGINYLTFFLRPVASREDNLTYYDDVIRHLRHMKDVAGIETLALGSDYDGMGSRLEWGDCGGNQLLLEALGKAFTADEVDLISHKNALRVFRDVIGE